MAEKQSQEVENGGFSIKKFMSWLFAPRVIYFKEAADGTTWAVFLEWAPISSWRRFRLFRRIGDDEGVFNALSGVKRIENTAICFRTWYCFPLGVSSVTIK